MVTNIERPVHYRFALSAENIAIVSESVAENSNGSNVSLNYHTTHKNYQNLTQIIIIRPSSNWQNCEEI